MLICEDFQSQCVTAVMEVHMHWWMFHTRTIIVALDDKVWAYSHLPSTHSSSMRAIQDRTSPPCDSFGTTKLISFFCSFAIARTRWQCFNKKMSLAGVEYGSQCYCGNKFNSKPIPSTACTMQCNANASELVSSPTDGKHAAPQHLA